MTTSLTSLNLRIAALLPLLALATGCPGKDGLLTSHEEDGSTGDPTGDQTDGQTDGQTDTAGPVGSETDPEPGTDTAADTGPSDDTGECETACTPEPESFACLRELAWNSGLIGLASREISGNCPSCDYSQVVLLSIDPVTAQQTLLGEAQVNSVGNAMAIAGDGSIFVAGNTVLSESHSSKALLLKFSPAGELLWQIEPEDRDLEDVVVRGEEIVVVGGDHELLAFAAADGAPLWDVASHDGFAEQLELDAEGALYVGGANPFPEGDALPSWYVRKYAGEGTLLWDHTSPMTELDRPFAAGLALDEAGGVVIGVRNDPSGAGPDSVSLHKLSVDGEPAWSRPLPVVIPDVATDNALHEVIGRPGGGVILVGGVKEDDAAYTIALDPDGEPLWQELKQGGGLDYLSNWTATAGAGGLLVSGCGYLEGSGFEGWLLNLTP